MNGKMVTVTSKTDMWDKTKTFHKNSSALTYYVAAIIAIVILVLNTGCQKAEPGTMVIQSTVTSLPPSITPKPTITPKSPNTLVIATPTPTNTATNTLVPTNTVEATVTFPPMQEEWFKYENSVYGFSAMHPTGWTPIELPNKVAFAYQGSSIALRILVKLVTEEAEIVRTGVPAGDLSMRGTVPFLGQELAKNVLVYQGKDKAILYNNAGAIEVGDLIFSISLESNRSDYESIMIPDDVQEQADKILESFELIK